MRVLISINDCTSEHETTAENGLCIVGPATKPLFVERSSKKQSADRIEISATGVWVCVVMQIPHLIAHHLDHRIASQLALVGGHDEEGHPKLGK